MFSFLPANRLQRHLLFWVVVAVYFWVPQWIYPDYIDTVTHYFFNFDYVHSPHFLPILFAYALGVGMLYAYAFLRWVVPPLLAGRYGLGIGLFALITVIICYFFRVLKGLHIAVLDPWLQHQPIRSFDRRHFQDFFVNQVYIHEYSTIILVLAVYKFFTNWQQKQLEASRLEQEKIRNEIRLVKAQVNPDFVFNSLDKLNALIEAHSKQAPTVVLTLANFLSYVLYESQADQVSLEHDLDAMKQYIALEKERLGDQIDISINITGDIPNQPIAPLLFLPFLENAFEHSLSTTDQAWLSLNLSVTEKTLKFSLANSMEPTEDGNFSLRNGLKTIQKRLNTVYPEHYELRLELDYGVFLVFLSLQLGDPTASTTDSGLHPLTTQSNETTMPVS